MSESLPVPVAPAPPEVPALVALDGATPRLEDLFRFMVDAELRVRSLRMRILEQRMTARGETEATFDVLLRDDGMARVTRRRSATCRAKYKPASPLPSTSVSVRCTCEGDGATGDYQ